MRELEHVIERVVVLCTQKTIEEDDIPLPGETNNPGRLSFSEMKANVIAQFEMNYVESLLITYKGNITRAAQAAQKERRTFWGLIRKYKIDVQRFKLNQFP